jgi:hypothetical protein
MPAYLRATGQLESWWLLFAVYRRLDPNGCAVTLGAGRPQLDRRCPIVRAHGCSAYRELVELCLGTKQRALA